MQGFDRSERTNTHYWNKKSPETHAEQPLHPSSAQSPWIFPPRQLEVAQLGKIFGQRHRCTCASNFSRKIGGNFPICSCLICCRLICCRLVCCRLVCCCIYAPVREEAPLRLRFCTCALFFAPLCPVVFVRVVFDAHAFNACSIVYARMQVNKTKELETRLEIL